MGSEVLYCYKCQRRLTESDFGHGEAMKVGSLSTCVDCADELLARLTPEQRRAALARVQAAADAATEEAEPLPARSPRHAAGPRATTSLRGGRPDAAPPARKPVALIAAVAGGGALLLLLAFAGLGGRNEPPPPPRPQPPARPAPAPVPPPPAPSPDAERAERNALVADIAALEKEARALTDTDEFRKAFDLLAAARARRRDPEWETIVGRLEKGVREAVDARYRPIETRAVEARRAGASVKAYRESVSRWGIPAQVEALDKALAAVPPAVPASGLALRLRFDETAGTEASDAAGGPPGRVHGQAAWEPGRYGSALRLNGYDTYVEIDNRPPLNPGPAMSIAVWIRADDWLGNYRIAQKGTADNQYRLTRETKPTMGMLFEIKDAGSVTAPLPDADGWHHLAATYDGSTLRIYWDGALSAQAPASGNIPQTNDTLCIGTKRAGAPPGDYFKGLMDDLLLYGRALTASEVATLAGRE